MPLGLIDTGERRRPRGDSPLGLQSTVKATAPPPLSDPATAPPVAGTRRQQPAIPQVGPRLGPQQDPLLGNFLFREGVRTNLASLGGNAEQRLRYILGQLTDRPKFLSQFAPLVADVERQGGLRLSLGDLQKLRNSGIIGNQQRLAFLDQVLAGARPQAQQGGGSTTGGGSGGGGGGSNKTPQGGSQGNTLPFLAAQESGPFILRGGRQFGSFGSSRPNLEEAIALLTEEGLLPGPLHDALAAAQ